MGRPALKTVPCVALAAAVVLGGCASDDPETSDPLNGDADGGEGHACDPPPSYSEDVSACVALATDYQPRANASADDSWPACISDDNAYHLIDPNVSSIARAAAFEQIADLLWERDTPPSPQDFIDARVIYAQPEGLDSRVQRRHDIHYPEPEGGARCSDAGIPDQYPDRCVGPAKLLPILNDAFAQGAAGEQGTASARVEAARIEAALLWFLYVSPLSEATSCATSAKDCDSAWAYYGGGGERETPLGLGRTIDALGPETHDRAYDGILAVRCWRDLDATPTATDLPRRDLARTQLDDAMLRGMALILRQRFATLACSSGDFQDAAFASIQILGGLLDRAARERDAVLADALALQVKATSPDEVDVRAAVSAVDALFPCP